MVFNVKVDCDGNKKCVPLYWLLNKAGYMANTSRLWAGSGGNACFHTFQLDHHDGPTVGPTDQWAGWQKQGHTWHIVPRNYSTKVGLIDLIMEKNWGKEEKSRRKMEKSEG